MHLWNYYYAFRLTKETNHCSNIKTGMHAYIYIYEKVKYLLQLFCKLGFFLPIQRFCTHKHLKIFDFSKF